MPRPSRNTDQALLRAGRKLLPETGIAGLSLRRVAAEAGVNPGMFHYHFKTKRRFVALVLQEIYEEFFKGFSMETSGSASPRERLRRALVALSRFARDNRGLFLMMFHDVIAGEEEAVRFARANLPRHLAIISALIRDCQEQELMAAMPVPSAVAFLAGAAAMPNFAMGLLERASARAPFGTPIREVGPLLIGDAAIARRVDLALRALAPEGA